MSFDRRVHRVLAKRGYKKTVRAKRGYGSRITKPALLAKGQFRNLSGRIALSPSDIVRAKRQGT